MKPSKAQAQQLLLIVNHDVRVSGMVRQDVLVVGLSRLEVPQGHHLGHRWAGVGGGIASAGPRP